MKGSKAVNRMKRELGRSALMLLAGTLGGVLSQHPAQAADSASTSGPAAERRRV